MIARFQKHILKFKTPSGTSRGILTTKTSYFLILEESGKVGYGECSLLSGLSFDDHPNYERKLAAFCQSITKGETLPDLAFWPSIRMGYEMALRAFHASNPFELYPSAFTRSEAAIDINGLVWMGSYEFMHRQIENLIKRGFRCIKIKIGAIAFDEELALLKSMRDTFDAATLTIRVDANGAFTPENAMEKLTRLAAYELHSIEQPIAAGQWDAMADLCQNSPIPIALDEELIGLTKAENHEKMLDHIVPQYIILKPSLIGGFSAADHWIELVEARGIGWWATSALESNIGLNAIAQWTFTKSPTLPQGLGTGSLFTNNIKSPLLIKNGYISLNNQIKWNFKL